MAPRLSDKLVRFAASLNTGLDATAAARAAGYAEGTAIHPGKILDRARAAGLILTVEEATAPLDAIRAAVTIDDWTAITAAAVKGARAGNDRDRTWLSERILGKVPQPVEGSGEYILTIRRGDDIGDPDA